MIWALIPIYIFGVVVTFAHFDEQTQCYETGRSFVGGLLWPLWALVALKDGLTHACRRLAR